MQSGVRTVGEGWRVLKATSVFALLQLTFRVCHRRRRFFSGTNLGSSIVDVPLATQKEIWHLPRDEKKELYGKYQVPVGGKESDAEDYEEEDDEAESGPGGSTPKNARVDPKESLPVFYWQPSGMLCDDDLYVLCGRCH